MGRKKAKQKPGSKAGSKSASASAPKAGGAGRGGPRLTGMVPVRFEPTVLEEVRRRAEEDGRSVSAWIRRAVDAELRRSGSSAIP